MSANKSNINHNQRGFGVIGILLLIVILAFVIGASWFVMQRNSNKQPNAATTEQQTTRKSYTDSAKLYSLTYPGTWSANEEADCCDGERVVYSYP